ncbi:ankyrin repeat domain-containing protein [Streptomyces sp. NPDC050738]|uniref:ankyrin repeat domain-containing protein n=1 Tax=Streptomyces sp. NPDC050738 TaxID=3154744 RepID=UPI00342161F3
MTTSAAPGYSAEPPEDEWSPVRQAVELQDVELLARLLDDGADPNEIYRGMTLLLHAIDVEGDSALQSGGPLTVATTAVLLAYGADPRLSGAPGGQTPLALAERYHHDLALRLLRRHMSNLPDVHDAG